MFDLSTVSAKQKLNISVFLSMVIGQNTSGKLKSNAKKVTTFIGQESIEEKDYRDLRESIFQSVDASEMTMSTVKPMVVLSSLLDYKYYGSSASLYAAIASAPLTESEVESILIMH